MSDHPHLTYLLEPAFGQVVKVSDKMTDFNKCQSLGVVLSIFSKSTRLRNLRWGAPSVQGNGEGCILLDK